MALQAYGFEHRVAQNHGNGGAMDGKGARGRAIGNGHENSLEV